MLPDIITKARARLLVRAPFFGSIALGLKWIGAPAVRTMATDGRAVWFNTAWCEAQGTEKTMGVMAHEVLHIVNKHHLRRRMRDLRLWNIACDLFVNRILEADKYALPDVLIFDTAGRFAGMPVEVIYQRLADEQPTAQQAGGAPGPGSQGPGPATAEAGSPVGTDRTATVAPAESGARCAT